MTRKQLIGEMLFNLGRYGGENGVKELELLGRCFRLGVVSDENCDLVVKTQFLPLFDEGKPDALVLAYLTVRIQELSPNDPTSAEKFATYLNDMMIIGEEDTGWEDILEKYAEELYQILTTKEEDM